MILNAIDIQQEMELDNIIIRPFREENLGTNSYDFHLANDFYLLRYFGFEPYFYGPVHVPDGEFLLLPSGETVLGYTKEVIGAVDDIVCQTRARSSTRRKGISLCDDAGFGDIGYIDHWTLELTANTSPYAPVKAGQRIGQMVFTAAGIARRKKGLKASSLQYNGQYRRRWPENMIPKDYRGNIVALDEPYTPYAFWALAARPQLQAEAPSKTRRSL